MNHLRSHFPVWGSVVDVDIASGSVSAADLDMAMQKVMTSTCYIRMESQKLLKI